MWELTIKTNYDSIIVYRLRGSLRINNTLYPLLHAEDYMLVGGENGWMGMGGFQISEIQKLERIE
jgi:hypothetical protein